MTKGLGLLSVLFEGKGNLNENKDQVYGFYINQFFGRSPIKLRNSGVEKIKGC